MEKDNKEDFRFNLKSEADEEALEISSTGYGLESSPNKRLEEQELDGKSKDDNHLD